jgi:type IV secretion system protein VirB10
METPSDLRNLHGKPPRSQREVRTSVVLLGVCTVAGIFAWAGWYLFFAPETPAAPKAEKQPLNTTPQAPPKALADLLTASKQPPKPPDPPAPPDPPKADPSAQLMAQLQRMGAQLTAMQARQAIQDEELMRLKNMPPPPAPQGPQPSAAPVTTKAADERKRRTDEAKQKAAAEKKEYEDSLKARLFWERKMEKDEELPGSRSSAYTITAGWAIPCIAKKAITSDGGGGQVVLTVRQNVYDSVTGNTLLIPQGSTMIGTKSGSTIYGDTRMNATLSAIRFPDGRGLKLNNAYAEDVTGKNGFSDQVDSHYWKLAASVLLTGVLRGGVTGVTTAGGNVGEAIAGQVAQQTATTGTQKVQQFIRAEPTLTIREGYLCQVSLGEDLRFAKPYAH